MTSKFNQFFSLLFPQMPESSVSEQTSPKTLEELLMMSQTLSSLRDMDETLGFLLKEIQNRLNVSCGVLMLENDVYKVRSHRGLSALFVRRFVIPQGGGTVGECISTNQSMVIQKRDFSKIGDPQIINEENWRSVFLAPISIKNQDYGVFIAGFSDRDTVDAKTIEVLDPYIRILSIGIRNTQLVEGMEKFNRRLTAEVTSTTQELTQTNARLIHRVRELKALYEITLSASSSTSLEDIFEAVSSRVRGLFNVEYLGFFIDVSGKSNLSNLVSQSPSFGLPNDIQESLRINNDQVESMGTIPKAIYDAFVSGEAKVVQCGHTTLNREFPIVKGNDALEKIIIRSIVAVPLKTAQKTLGVMVLANPLGEFRRFSDGHVEYFTEEEMRTLTLISIRVATAIDTVRLDLEVKKRLADFSTLQQINDTFYATPILEFILAKIVKVINKSLKCDLSDFILFEPNNLNVEVYSGPTSSGDSESSFNLDDITYQVVTEKKTRIFDEVKNEFSLKRLGLDKRVQSLMLVPLKVESDVIGILRIGSYEKSFFDHHHIRLAELIADRSAVIAQNVRLYEKILEANRELERLNRMKTEFVSMVSHELRTPVTAIKGFVDIVLSEDVGPINEQQRRFLQISHNSIERLTLLISDLLDISRIESGKMKISLLQITVEKMLNEIVDVYRPTVEAKNINFSFDIDRTLPKVMADESRIKQVIENLLSNAVKFTPEGGFIKIIAEDLGDFVLVAVMDSGVGIKKELQERIFSMFYQVDSSLTRKSGGTGLGLSISKSIVEMHGGRIWADSEVGKGSTFRFILPRIRDGHIESYDNSFPNNPKIH